MLAVSKSSVDHWEELRQGPTKDDWEKHKKMVLNRFENLNVTAGLVLTSSAVFISTSPPIQSLIPYANEASYILQFTSFIAALMSLMTGTSVLIIYDPCYAHREILDSFRECRRRLILCLALMALPSLSLVFSTVVLMAAVLIAGFTSDQRLVKILTGITCALLVGLVVVIIDVFKVPMEKTVRGNDNAITRKTRGTRSKTGFHGLVRHNIHTHGSSSTSSSALFFHPET